ncbi:Rieske [2Fe-2S] iron-sulfur domain-containing protein, partial [Endogone sp. FLAS-F59071]
MFRDCIPYFKDPILEEALITVPSIPQIEIELETATHDDSVPKPLPKRFQQQGYDIDTDVRNMWYPIAIAAEVNNKHPEGLHILGDPIVTFRDKDGQAVCLADKCAHRSAPLSTGQIVDGILECKYHGWQYDANGLVTHIPSLLPDRKIPSNAKTYSYPVHEQDDLLWVWPGDEDKADITLVPHMKPGSYVDQGTHYNEHKWGKGTLYIQDLDID